MWNKKRLQNASCFVASLGRLASHHFAVASKIFGLVCLLQLNGCAYSTFYVSSERLVYPPTTPASIAISSQKTVRHTHKILGRVAAITRGGGDAARNLLQEQAARIGANLIIDYRIESGFGKTSASGLAVLLFQEK